MWPTSAQQLPVIRPWFIYMLFLVWSFSSFLVGPNQGSAAFAGRSLVILKTCPSHFFIFKMMQTFSSVVVRLSWGSLANCCVVESGVGDDLRPIHLQYFPYAGSVETVTLNDITYNQRYKPCICLNVLINI